MIWGDFTHHLRKHPSDIIPQPASNGHPDRPIQDALGRRSFGSRRFRPRSTDDGHSPGEAKDVFGKMVESNDWNDGCNKCPNGIYTQKKLTCPSCPLKMDYFSREYI